MSVENFVRVVDVDAPRIIDPPPRLRRLPMNTDTWQILTERPLDMHNTKAMTI
jgi:hypothetical protein